MMKKISLLIIIMLIPFLSACHGSFTLMYEDPNQISSIEIVDATGEEIVTLLLIDSSLHDNFLQGLTEIKFHRVYGDPPESSNLSVKIIYTNNDYEVFSYYGGYKVSNINQNIIHNWLVCDEDEFKDWISIYYPLE